LRAATAEADVRAVNRATGTVTATRAVGRTGRFTLSLAPANVSGVVTDGGDGFFNNGSITVTPAGIG
jgi:hypothetical protein